MAVGDAGGGCKVAFPNLPQNVFADGPRARQNTPAQPISRRGRLGSATLQPPPASSCSHFRERFLKNKEYYTQKQSEHVVYNTVLLGVGKATSRHTNPPKPLTFFLLWVANTQLHHWTNKWVVSTRLIR